MAGGCYRDRGHDHHDDYDHHGDDGDDAERRLTGVLGLAEMGVTSARVESQVLTEPCTAAPAQPGRVSSPLTRGEY